MNKQYLPKIVVIVGPTASGKSDMAVQLAKKFDGKIISADSRQVYRGLNIGSGKITKKEMRGIPHYLLDVADPKNTYTASNYQKSATRAINSILKRGKLPIIVGGTGFYIQAVVEKMSLPVVKPNKKLRRELSDKSATELYLLLNKLDPERAKSIDQHNPRRLIRAIEIATALGQVPILKSESPYDALWLGVNWPATVLQKRIATRLKSRLRAGMVAEVERLRNVNKVSWQRLDDMGLEYRYVSRHLQGQLTREQMEENLLIAINQYAKRQMTWFKRFKQIRWLNKGVGAEKLTKQFLCQTKTPH